MGANFQHLSFLWHLWWLAASIGAAALVALVVFRKRVTRALRLMKAVATDPRLPKPVRWLFRIAFLMKVVPVPDFGLDEIMLVAGALLLYGPYRATWRAIREDVR